MITFIETNILGVLPDMDASPNYYNLNDNDSKKINNTYSVRPLDANAIAGTIKSATYEQPFEVEITRNFSNPRQGDAPLRAAIEALFIDHQLITKQLSLKKSSMILLVGVPNKGAPNIDEQNKFVSVTYTYPIQYRETL